MASIRGDSQAIESSPIQHLVLENPEPIKSFASEHQDNSGLVTFGSNYNMAVYARDNTQTLNLERAHLFGLSSSENKLKGIIKEPQSPEQSSEALRNKSKSSRVRFSFEKLKKSHKFFKGVKKPAENYATLSFETLKAQDPIEKYESIASPQNSLSSFETLPSSTSESSLSSIKIEHPTIITNQNDFGRNFKKSSKKSFFSRMIFKNDGNNVKNHLATDSEKFSTTTEVPTLPVEENSKLSNLKKFVTRHSQGKLKNSSESSTLPNIQDTDDMAGHKNSYVIPKKTPIKNLPKAELTEKVTITEVITPSRTVITKSRMIKENAFRKESPDVSEASVQQHSIISFENAGTPRKQAKKTPRKPGTVKSSEQLVKKVSKFSTKSENKQTGGKIIQDEPSYSKAAKPKAAQINKSKVSKSAEKLNKKRSAENLNKKKSAEKLNKRSAEKLNKKRSSEKLNKNRSSEKLNKRKSSEKLNKNRSSEKLNKNRSVENLNKKKSSEKLSKKKSVESSPLAKSKSFPGKARKSGSSTTLKSSKASSGTSVKKQKDDSSTTKAKKTASAKKGKEKKRDSKPAVRGKKSSEKLQSLKSNSSTSKTKAPLKSNANASSNKSSRIRASQSNSSLIKVGKGKVSSTSGLRKKTAKKTETTKGKKPVVKIHKRNSKSVESSSSSTPRRPIRKGPAKKTQPTEFIQELKKSWELDEDSGSITFDSKLFQQELSTGNDLAKLRSREVVVSETYSPRSSETIGAAPQYNVNLIEKDPSSIIAETGQALYRKVNEESDTPQPIIESPSTQSSSQLTSNSSEYYSPELLLSPRSETISTEKVMKVEFAADLKKLPKRPQASEKVNIKSDLEQEKAIEERTETIVTRHSPKSVHDDCTFAESHANKTEFAYQSFDSMLASDNVKKSENVNDKQKLEGILLDDEENGRALDECASTPELEID